MAIYNTNTNVTCTCGNDVFTEAEVFRIIKKPVKSTLTETTVLEKQVIGTEMKCTVCGKTMPNPLVKH